ncbi:PII uridylyl-transferase [Sulfurifustis variabilis]|uniref:Bifunctional uridylyltransferase/uridylyl-removing enzyme n=1 Tax=Sulfurifustis variabilis TaxID=1675686 RepID=A0A1B4V9K3_9GAMM|nr:[protein-PII] uridylyltransferase [Sulfurifustis variabilis]BAU48174.1 PII uridylyl-transferase [Sulfurifustis variabilis]
MHVGKEAIFKAREFDAALAHTDHPLPLFQSALASGRAALKEAYLGHAAAPTIVRTHAALVDALLVRAWRWHLSRRPVDVPVALVAAGGYGRGELHPASDIDILILLEKSHAERVRDFVEELLRFLWDVGLDVGHSVRNLKECVREAKKDITVATNLMETRLLHGDPMLFERMRTLTHATRIWPSARFFKAKLEEQRARHRRFDDTGYNLEPNIKEGPGGLRDIQTIAWVTQRHFDTTSLHDLVELEFLSEEEYRALVQCRNFLWRVRCGLHYLAGRREDRLLFDHQRALARQFGYVDRPGILAVEQFMKRYYRTVKELSLLNEILLQHFQEAMLARGRAKATPINRRFRSVNGFLDVTHPRVFEHAPYAMLELFLVLQQQPKLKGVRANAIRLLRANLDRIDHRFRRDLGCRSLFMEILRQRRGITHELRRMNAYGVLGAYIPVFGRIVGQMQHDLFHVYTVDQHTLFVIRNLRRFTVPEFRHEFPLASELIERVFKPERLYLAALFHDIAKGRGGDHSTLGAREAEAFCRLHNLSDYDTRFVSWLVRHHLLMSWTAQHQDISDPDVVLAFARQVGDQEHLDSLYLLTVADMRGTSPQVWNAWKGRLLAQLYAATSRVLDRGLATPVDLDAHVADLKAEALALLEPSGIPEEVAQRCWQDFGPDYFLRYDAESLAWQVQEIIRAASTAEWPVVGTRYGPEIGGTEFLIYTPDRPDLFVILTSGFDRMNLSIVDARIHTTRAGFALDTFVVLDHAGDAIQEPRALLELQRAMREHMLNPRPGRDPRQVHLARTLKHFPTETRVAFSSSLKGEQTVMEVTAQDRPGLLYQVALALSHCNVNLIAAKVSTYGERAEDVFFINTRDRRPITDQAQLDCLSREIYRRLGQAAADATPASVGF